MSEHPRWRLLEACHAALQVDSTLKAYATKYHTIKAPRKLQWHPHLGSVDLKVTVGTHVLELSVSTVHAAILCHFKVKRSSAQHLQAIFIMRVALYCYGREEPIWLRSDWSSCPGLITFTNTSHTADFFSWRAAQSRLASS